MLEESSFDGKWVNISPVVGNNLSYIVFDNGRFEDGTGITGNFIFTDIMITFFPIQGEIWTQEYVLTGKSLALIAVPGHLWGVFIKETENSKFEGVWKHATSASHDALTFKDSSFILASTEKTVTGNFVFTDERILFYTSKSNFWKQDYVLSENKLTTRPNKSRKFPEYITGEFDKQQS